MPIAPSAPVKSADDAVSSSHPTLRDYARVTIALALFGVGLYWVVRTFRGEPARATQLLGPLFAMIAATALIWLSMVAVRNYATLRNLVRGDYFRTYRGEAPPEWIERPARTFNNLMQLPWLFHVACLLMLLLDQLDAAQVALAWVFVSLRVLHASIYIAFNHLPSRFGSWVAGAVTLWTLWMRLVSQTWHLL